jgi:hypothetical protein
MTSTKRERRMQRAMPPGPKLGFSLVAGIKDESCDVILGIPKEKGLETEGID